MIFNIFKALVLLIIKVGQAVIQLETPGTPGAQKRADAIVIVQGLETAAEAVVPLPGWVKGILNNPTVIGWCVDTFVNVLNAEQGHNWAALLPTAPAVTVQVVDAGTAANPTETAPEEAPQ